MMGLHDVLRNIEHIFTYGQTRNDKTKLENPMKL
jgi:hypothetical protein